MKTYIANMRLMAPMFRLPWLIFAPVPSPPLPIEILSTIFAYIPPRIGPFDYNVGTSTLFNCSLVSRAWRAAALPLLWEHLHMGFDKNGTHEVLRQLTFSITNSLPGAPQDHFHVLNLVKRITLDSRRSVVPVVLPTTPSLNILQLFSPKQLQEICLHYTRLNAELFSVILPIVFPNLTRNLRHLKFYGVCESGTDGDIVLQNLPATLASIRLVGDDHSKSIPASFSRVFALPNLRNLALWHIDFIQPQELEQALRAWGPCFRSLDITHCRNLFRDSVVRALADHCPNLVSLELAIYPGCPNVYQDITDVTLCRLVDSCPDLATLRLRGVRGVSDAFLVRCASRARAMRCLRVYDPQLWATGKGVLAVRAWGRMKELEIMRGGFIDEDIEMDEGFVSAVEEMAEGMTLCRLGKREIVPRCQ
ncbi:hypothetical protein BC938DRAFT_472745 [Jimgerdemannia flammicorona]|uniref:F-box domain-containing protein n=1 Tax=Jimgerdemannia flammicorona TaxID=994334 RepID=A0A433Q5G8_9FUNG|nr:hypothetical protein BC938DRAFT_472745 [Jimgerdemannia flammicorona]